MSQSSSECWKWRYHLSFNFDPAALSSFSSLFLPVFPSLLFNGMYCGCGNVFSFKLVICQNIALHALPMARNSAFLISSFPVHSASFSPVLFRCMSSGRFVCLCVQACLDYNFWTAGPSSVWLSTFVVSALFCVIEPCAKDRLSLQTILSSINKQGT